MSIDLYSPRVLIPAYREMKPVGQFFIDTFFLQQRTYRTENIDIDQQVKGRRVAPFVNRWAPGKYIERQGFETSNVAPPCVATKMSITAQDVSTRVMGEHVYANLDPAARARLLLADDLANLDEMHRRRQELMCRDVLFDSAVTCTGEDYSATFTFTRTAALTVGTLGGSNAWTHTDSDPFKAIDEWCELYAKTSGLVPTDLVFGGTAYQTFLANTKVQNKLNLLRMDLGAMRQEGLPNGVRRVGTLPGLNLWTYHEWYDDPDNGNTTTVLVPAKKILLASRNLRTEMRFGAVQDLSDDTDNAVPTLVETTALPRSWVTKDPPVRFLELRSRPLPVPIQNHFLTVQVQA